MALMSMAAIARIHCGLLFVTVHSQCSSTVYVTVSALSRYTVAVHCHCECALSWYCRSAISLYSAFSQRACSDKHCSNTITQCTHSDMHCHSAVRQCTHSDMHCGSADMQCICTNMGQSSKRLLGIDLLFCT